MKSKALLPVLLLLHSIAVSVNHFVRLSVRMYVCMYVVCMYVCSYVCIQMVESKFGFGLKAL